MTNRVPYTSRNHAARTGSTAATPQLFRRDKLPGMKMREMVSP